MELHSDIESYRKVLAFRTPEGQAATVIVMRRRSAVWLTFCGAEKTTVVTRYRVTPDDCKRLNTLTSIKATLLFTYSGITDTRLEPFPSSVAETSLRTAAPLARAYRTIFYWRPWCLV